jgi:hypothetical protein
MFFQFLPGRFSFSEFRGIFTERENPRKYYFLSPHKEMLQANPGGFPVCPGCGNPAQNVQSQNGNFYWKCQNKCPNSYEQLNPTAPSRGSFNTIVQQRGGRGGGGRGWGGRTNNPNPTTNFNAPQPTWTSFAQCGTQPPQPIPDVTPPPQEDRTETLIQEVLELKKEMREVNSKLEMLLEGSK